MTYLDTDYQLDSTELGKIITIFSTAALIFSIHGYYTMESVETTITESQDQLEEGLGFVESDDSQRIIEALQDVSAVTDDFSVLQRGFQEAEQSLNSTREARTSVKNTKKQYQWMTVISISAIIAGITMMLIEVG